MVTLANILNNPTGMIILLVVVILLFGGAKIPELMKSIGQGKKAFEDGLKTGPEPRADDDEMRKDKEREAEIRRRVEAEMRAGK